jgi:hypothetical protein
MREIRDISQFNYINNIIYIFYSFDYMYILKEINSSPNEWAFVSLNDSDSWANGRHNTPKKAISTALRNNNVIYEFDTIEEFFIWGAQILNIKLPDKNIEEHKIYSGSRNIIW